MTLAEATDLLYQALDTEVGLLLQADPPERVRQQLYAARRRAEDSSLDCLQIRLSPIEGGNLVICHAAKAANGAAE